MKRKVVKILLVGLLGLAILGGLVVSGQAKEETILRWVIDYPVSLDPAIGMPKFVSNQAHVNMYSPLVYPTPEGGVKPHVAERWVISEDGLTYTFYLGRGVLFSDRSELNAEDVVFSFERLLTIGEQSAYHFKGKVASIEAVGKGKYTVRFHLTRPFGPFLRALITFYIVNKDEVMAHIEKPGAYGEFGDYGTNYLRFKSAGSGAYMVKEFEPRTRLLMEKNPYHSFESAPNSPDLVEIGSNIDPVAVQTMMKHRELEISDRWQPTESLDTMAGFEGVEVGGWLAPSMLDVMFHTRKPPTDDIHIRKALSWAFDYGEALGIFPRAIQSRGPVNHVVPGGNPNVFQYHHDLAKAREEIAKSKYAGELDKYPIEFGIWTGAVTLEQLALLFQANAAEIGVKVEILSMPIVRWFDCMTKMETTHNTEVCWNMTSYPEAGARLLKYHSSTTGTHEQCEWLLDPEMDQLIEDALAIPGEKERFAKYYEIQDRILELTPTIFVHDEFERHAYQAYYINWPQLKQPLPVTGYNFDARFIEVFPEKRQELLGR